MSKERPVRAGAPSFGQTVSRSTHSYEAPQESEVLQSSENQGLMDRQAGIVDRVNFQFKAPKNLDAAHASSTLEGLQNDSEAIALGQDSYTDTNGQKHINFSIYV